MGVTGTLCCLPNHIKNHLDKNYQISKNCLFPIPSVYGLNSENRVILPSKCVKKEDHTLEVIKSLESELSKDRPILIFFRSKIELFKFYQSPKFEQYQINTDLITE